MKIARIPKQPKRPIDYVSSGELIHELLMALRDVVAAQSTLIKYNNGNKVQAPEYEQLRFTINKIISLRNRLNGHETELEETLKEAGKQTDLNLRQLLEDCQRFPEVFPYVRNLKGLRKFFLCHCETRESIDQQGLALCYQCLESAIRCLKERKKYDQFILYSSYSPQVRCRHADFKTLLVTFNKPGLWPPAWCEMCLQQEKSRLHI